MQTIRQSQKGHVYKWIIVLSICKFYGTLFLDPSWDPLTCHEVRNPTHLHLHPATFADISLLSWLKISLEIECIEQTTFFGRGAMKDELRFTFGIFGNVTALALFLAPVITFTKIVRRGSTEEFSGIPYVFTMLNCLLYAWYGLPFVTSHNVELTTVNGAGAALEFIYVCIYLMYAPPKPRMKILRFFMGVLVFFTAVAVISLLAVHHNARKLLVGSIATAFSVCMYASPLSIMRLVIQTKSVKYMPFLLSLFVFLCGTSWFLYGIFGKDAFVAAPNGIGASLGIAQLVLYFIYKDSAPNKDEEADEGGKGHDIVKPFSSVNQV